MANVISSTNNTFAGEIAIDGSFNGTYDDASGYEVVRLWCSTPNEAAELRLFYADTSINGHSSEVSEVYNVFRNHASAIHSLKKKRYVRLAAINNSSSVALSNTRIVTKFARRLAHPV